MGRTLDAVCARRDDVRVIGHVGRGGCESLDALNGLDAALDFSAPENLPMLLSGAVRRRIPLVIGTTGMSGAQGEAIRAASRRIPIVWSENFSVGVTVLARLARLAAQALGREFDMEIVETHHNPKGGRAQRHGEADSAADRPGGAVCARLRAVGADRRARPGNRRARGARGYGGGRAQPALFRADGGA